MKEMSSDIVKNGKKVRIVNANKYFANTNNDLNLMLEAIEREENLLRALDFGVIDEVEFVDCLDKESE